MTVWRRIVTLKLCNDTGGGQLITIEEQIYRYAQQLPPELRGLEYLGQAYQDNRAVLQYELARRRLQVAETLMKHAPRPIVVQSDGGDASALTTLITAQLLPKLANAADGM
nr:hypothetical protein [Chloroflexus sp.]